MAPAGNSWPLAKPYRRCLDPIVWQRGDFPFLRILTIYYAAREPADGYRQHPRLTLPESPLRPAWGFFAAATKEDGNISNSVTALEEVRGVFGDRVGGLAKKFPLLAMRSSFRTGRTAV